MSHPAGDGCLEVAQVAVSLGSPVIGAGFLATPLAAVPALLPRLSQATENDVARV